MDIQRLVQQLSADLRIDMPLGTLVHVGANTGQEVQSYETAGIRGYHLEAHPAFYEELAKGCADTANQTPVLACCDEAAGRHVEFNVTNNTQSSSLLPLGRHAVTYPQIKITETITVTTTTLDRLAAKARIPPHPDFLVLDVQGAEARVLKGGQTLLSSPSLWGIVCEVSLDPLYEGGATFDEIDAHYMKPNGFFLRAANFNRNGWANAVFMRRWWRIALDETTPLEQALHWTPDHRADQSPDTYQSSNRD